MEERLVPKPIEEIILSPKFVRIFSEAVWQASTHLLVAKRKQISRNFPPPLTLGLSLQNDRAIEGITFPAPISTYFAKVYGTSLPPNREIVVFSSVVSTLPHSQKLQQIADCTEGHRVRKYLIKREGLIKVLSLYLCPNKPQLDLIERFVSEIYEALDGGDRRAGDVIVSVRVKEDMLEVKAPKIMISKSKGLALICEATRPFVNTNEGSRSGLRFDSPQIKWRLNDAGLQHSHSEDAICLPFKTSKNLDEPSKFLSPEFDESPLLRGGRMAGHLIPIENLSGDYDQYLQEWDNKIVLLDYHKLNNAIFNLASRLEEIKRSEERVENHTFPVLAAVCDARKMTARERVSLGKKLREKAIRLYWFPKHCTTFLEACLVYMKTSKKMFSKFSEDDRGYFYPKAANTPTSQADSTLAREKELAIDSFDDDLPDLPDQETYSHLIELMNSPNSF